MAPLRAAALGAALAAASAAIPVVPFYPANAQYYATGVVSMPYPQINLSMPFETYVDGTGAGRQRLSYYADMDVYIYRGDLNVTWQLSPEVNAMTCFTSNGSVSVTPLLPDTTGYQFTGNALVNGQTVNQYQLVTSQGNKTATYNFSVLASDNYTPVQLSFLGRDLVLGSHTDIYVFDYTVAKFGNANSWPQGIFGEPAGFDCGGFPGPGAGDLAAQGNALIRELMPGPLSQPVSHTSDPRFAAFMEAYGKGYADDAEARLRHSLFTRSRRVIDHHNRKSRVERRSLRLAMNPLGDATPEEMALRLGRQPDGSSYRAKAVPQQPAQPASSVHPVPSAAALADLPISVDWRIQGAVEPVMDQGVCGSCWTFGATAAISGQYFLKYGRMVSFSKQEVVDCSWPFGVDGCGGGEDFLAYSWMMANGGLASKDQYGPYLSQNGYCKANTAGVTARLSGYVNVTSGSEAALMDALANVGPISISVDAAVDTFTFYSSGVLDDPACLGDPADQDHTIVAIGYGTDATTGETYWIARNSWSTWWGDGGYIKIARANNVCGVTDSPTYPILI